ncbi:ComEC/Rec2 family competence protein [Terricaulis sp.]|uniref:ComEC/Rec2 family competence protein n=1 Tax=Terricaulis sp. TaxID=2768686 RepID=UPI002AC5F0B0|nr:ComEC/Rec2 family competence protein [Terricaulis sp.]MDZ4693231.1 ComEC/Rec2 family competence protein [Terricaulis sp.]
MFALQRDRWILWLPVGMIVGAAAWLLAARDPPIWIGPLCFVLGTSGAIGFAAWPSTQATGWGVDLRRCLAGLCALAAASGLGASAAQLRVVSVAQSAFSGGEAPVRVEGWVVANDASDNGPRLRLLVRSIEGVESPPRYVRMSVSDAGLLSPGRAARCRGVLGPPAGPLAPGGYDFARRAYFERLGATGFAFGRCRPIAIEPPPSWLDRQRLWLAAVRADLAAAIYDAAPYRGGAIAAALVAGDRSLIDEETNIALRDSGLGHLLSVSGIHMGVVGGLVFAMLLWTLSLIPPIALRVPVKKVAAVGALIVLAAYLIVSGSSVPAIRAFVMACVAFGAILLDRPAISMRGLALAALVVVMIFPESVLEPGFQMSFAATMALVALFEMLKRAPHEPALPTPGPIIGALQATTRGIGGVLLISFVAGLATDPFAIYHFQRFAVYSLPANLITAPIMSFLVAPMAAAAAILAPFGLADPALELMASALDLIAAVGQTFGERPEAVRAVPRPPEIAFVLCVVALLWACLWRGALRWGALPIFAASLALYVAAPRPVLAFDADLRAIYARDNDRWTLLAKEGRSTFARDRLGSMLGLAPAEIERLAPPEACSEGLCQWRRPAGDIFLVRDPGQSEQACIARAIVLTSAAMPDGYAQRCRLGVLIDAQSLALLGGATITETPLGPRVARAWSADTQRPWTPAVASADQE